jgi:hypothetical protein
MKKSLLIVMILVMAGCATVRKVESGKQNVGERLTLQIEGPWNHVDFPGIKPAQLWTMEGIYVDELLIYSGIKDGEAMHPGGQSNNKKDVTFRSSMQTDELVSMFEAVLTRDGSTFKLVSIAPRDFGGKKGVAFEFERTVKVSDVIQKGIGFGAIDKGALFAVVYVAPRLTFFPRHRSNVEAIVHSAVIQ